MCNAQINEVVKHKSLGLAFSSDVTWTEHIAYIVNEAWWSDQSRLATLLSSLIARPWVGLQTLCALRSPAGKGLTSWLSFVVSNCEFVTFPLVSWVRCGT